MNSSNNNVYKILIVLGVAISSSYCMTPSQTLAELMSSSTGSSSTSTATSRSSLSSLLFPDTTQLASSTRPQSTLIPISSSSLSSLTYSHGSTSSSMGSSGTYIRQIELPDAVTLVPCNWSLSLSNSVPDSLIFNTNESIPDASSGPNTQKSEILSALKNLARNSDSSKTGKFIINPPKRARIETLPEVAKRDLIAADKFLNTDKVEHSSSGDKVMNISELISLIAQRNISSGTDLAKFVQINKACNEMFSGKNLLDFLSKLKERNTNAYLDIATHKNYMYMINKHINQQLANLKKLRANRPSDVELLNAAYTNRSELNTLNVAASKYNNLAVIRNLAALNEITDDGLVSAILKNRENIVLFILSHDRNLYNTCKKLCIIPPNLEDTQPILHIISTYSTNSMLKSVLELLKMKIENPDEYSNIVNQKNSRQVTILHKYAEKENPHAITICLNFFNDIATTNNLNETALHITCAKNNTQIAKDLLSSLTKSGALANSMKPCHRGHTPLSYAVKNNNIELINILLKMDPIVHKEGMGQTLAWALLNKSYSLFEHLLSLYEIKSRSEMINACLIEVFKLAFLKNIELDMIKFLVEKHNADITSPTIIQHIINLNHCNKNCLPIVEYLVSNGALISSDTLTAALSSENLELITNLCQGMDVTGIDSDGDTILHKHAFISEPAVIRVLMQLGADPKIKNKLGQSVLHLSIASQSHTNERVNIEVLKLLIDSGCSIHEQDSNGNTPLFYFRFLNVPEEFIGAKFLLSQGANLEHRNNNGETWMNYLIKHSTKKGIYEDLVEFIKLKCNINTTDTQVNTPLHNYLSNTNCYDEDPSEHLAAIELLIRNGANIEAKNSEGNTPLHILINNLNKIIDHDTFECDEYDHLNLQDFIKLFAESFTIRNHEGNRPYDIALALANTDEYRNDADALRLLLQITQLIKPT